MSGAISGASGQQDAVPAPSFRERLSPALWIWAVAIGLGLMAALSTWPFGPLVIAITAVVALSSIVFLLLTSSPVVSVTGDELVAGRARITANLLGPATPLDADAMRYELGPGLDVRAYLCMRGWIPKGVRVELIDPDDPTPYWLISSHRPAELAAALEQARVAAGRAG